MPVVSNSARSISCLSVKSSTLEFRKATHARKLASFTNGSVSSNNNCFNFFKALVQSQLNEDLSQISLMTLHAFTRARTVVVWMSTFNLFTKNVLVIAFASQHRDTRASMALVSSSVALRTSLPPDNFFKHALTNIFFAASDPPFRHSLKTSLSLLD